MKEEQNVSGSAQPEGESKTKKFIRIAGIFVLISFFVLVFVMAALKKCGT
jgi:hypothetical protein